MTQKNPTTVFPPKINDSRSVDSILESCPRLYFVPLLTFSSPGSGSHQSSLDTEPGGAEQSCPSSRAASPVNPSYPAHTIPAPPTTDSESVLESQGETASLCPRRSAARLVTCGEARNIFPNFYRREKKLSRVKLSRSSSPACNSDSMVGSTALPCPALYCCAGAATQRRLQSEEEPRSQTETAVGHQAGAGAGAGLYCTDQCAVQTKLEFRTSSSTESLCSARCAQLSL